MQALLVVDAQKEFSSAGKRPVANYDSAISTIRQHAVAVYQKSGLGGRAELAAFFLEGIPTPARPS